MKKAFTILEIFLYISILSVGLVLLSTLYYISGAIKTKNEIIMEVNNQGSEIIELIRQEVNDSIEIRLPASGQASDELVLIDNNGQEIAFLNRDNRLDRFNSSGTSNLLSDQIILNDISFSTIGDNDGRLIGVNLIFSLTYRALSERQEYNYSQEFNSFILKR